MFMVSVFYKKPVLFESGQEAGFLFCFVLLDEKTLLQDLASLRRNGVALNVHQGI